MYLATECVVLRSKNFQEADRLLTIFTKDFGKISAIAKGARRPASKKAGHIEPGTWCKISLAKGKNIDLLTEVELKQAYGIDNFTQEKAAKVYHFLEIVDHLTVLNQKNSEVFSLLVKFLGSIKENENFNLVASVFKIRLLKTLGFFSAVNLKSSKARELLVILENSDQNSLPDQAKLSANSYLKLTSFLDSMIESLTDRKLNTPRFLNGEL